MDISNRLQILKQIHEAIENLPELSFKDLFGKNSNEIKRGIDVKGCYLIYEKGKDSPIYVGSNRSVKRNVRTRLSDLKGAKNHVFAHRIISEQENRKIEEKNRGKITKQEIVDFQKYCSDNFSLRVYQDEKNWKLTEAGLIFLYKPRYNSESIS